MFLKKIIVSTSTLALLAFGINKLPNLVETKKINNINGIKKQLKSEEVPFSNYDHDYYANTSKKIMKHIPDAINKDKKQKRTEDLSPIEREELLRKHLERLAKLQEQYESTTSKVVTPETAPNIANEAKQFGEDTKDIAKKIVKQAYKNAEGKKSINVLKNILNNYGGNSYRDSKISSPTP
jgi:succinate dehydrogenase/fumarate reductase flavoprotein subunit